MTHIFVSKQTTIGSDNGLSPGRRQAIIWTNAGILLIWTLGTNFSEILREIHVFSFKKIHLKMSSVKWRPFCLGLNVLIHTIYTPILYLPVNCDGLGCSGWCFANVGTHGHTSYYQCYSIWPKFISQLPLVDPSSVFTAANMNLSQVTHIDKSGGN